MATQTGTTLKTYFNTGDQPTEAQFVDLIDSNLNLTDGGTVTGTFTLGGIQSSTATDAAFYSINSSRGEIRSQVQSPISASTGFTLELRNTSITATSLIVANVIGGDGAIITGSVVTANVVGASTASLNFFNTGGEVIADDAVFTASFAIL